MSSHDCQDLSEFMSGPYRPSWDVWAVGLAEAAAQRADCTRRQVGAVILDVDHRVIGVGYNGAPAGRRGCLTAGACPRGQLSHDELAPDSAYTGPGVAAPCIAVHAEENALLFTDPIRRRGGTIAISCPPCPGCLRLIGGSGLAHIVWRHRHGGVVSDIVGDGPVTPS